MHDLGEAVVEALGSPSRLKIMQLLELRPRSVPELADMLNLTRQAIIKHLARLEELGLVSVEERRRGAGVGKLYKLRMPLDVELGTSGRSFRLHLFVYSGSNTAGRERAGRDYGYELSKEVRRVYRDLHLAKVKLKFARERERRFFEEAAELRTMLDEMLRKCGCAVTEEVLIKSYLEGELKASAKYLGLSEEEANKALGRLGFI